MRGLVRATVDGGCARGRRVARDRLVALLLELGPSLLDRHDARVTISGIGADWDDAD